MGIEVQHRSSLPGNYSMGNLNEDTNSSWYYEDKTLNGHLYNGFMLKPVNGYSEYDKEMLKRTMLEHDAVFRKQVYELHRLYRVQKDLMDELKAKESNRFSLPINTPQSNLFSSQMSNSSFHGASAGRSNGTRPPLDSMKETSTQSSSIPSMNGTSLKDEGLWDFKLTKRKKFDLELPADVYLDDEDAERAKKENVNNATSGICVSDSHGKDDLLRHRLVDLNEPINDIHEGEIGLVDPQFLSVRADHEGMQGHQFYRDFFSDMRGSEASCSKFPNTDKGKTRQQWPFFHNEIGQKDVEPFRPGISSEKLWMPSKSMQLMHTSHEIAVPDQKIEAYCINKPSKGTELYGRNHHLASTATSPVPSWIKSVKPTTPSFPMEVQAVSGFDGSSLMNGQSNTSYVSTQHLSNAFRSNATSSSEIPSSLKSFNHGFPSNSTSMYPQLPSPSFCTPSFNNQYNSSPYGNSRGLNQALRAEIRDGLLADGDVERSHKELSGELSWLGAKPVCSSSGDVKKCAFEMESDSSRGFSQLPDLNRKQDKGKRSNLWGLRDFPSSLKFKESTIKKDEVSGCMNGKKILTFPILDKLQENPISSPPTNDSSSSRKHGLVPNSVLSSEKDVGNSNKRSRNCIDVNVPASSKNSHGDEAEIPSPLSVLSVAGKIALDIDLEAPIASQPEEKINSQELETDHLAAENLISMSLNIGSCSGGLPCHLAPSSCGPLHWFAELVSKEGDAEDDFESIILKLKELKPDEYFCRPSEMENPMDEGPSTASLLLTKPRKVRARKRRQRRDFQKDILPGLASLSRNEVTEDLQALGVVIRKSGRSSKASLASRNSRRSEVPPQERGKRGPRSPAVSVPTPIQPTFTETELDGRAVVGWGRTRRCRRQRAPSGNASALLT